MQPKAPRPYILRETTYPRILELQPTVAVLPWGATEAHGHHLPYATDVLQAEAFASRAAEIAVEKGGRPVVLPAIPFGNNAQQLDQAATVHLSSSTAFAVLRDITRSMKSQGIDRLLIVNSHGGNEFRPAVRDLQLETGVLIVVADFFRMLPDLRARLFTAPGDHADEMETSLMLHLVPHLVDMEAAGRGERRPFDITALEQPGVWSPRPWSAVHPDTGSGDPRGATAAKGGEFFEAVSGAMAEVIVGLSDAQRGDLPYLGEPG